jgi:hypothetical protein
LVFVHVCEHGRAISHSDKAETAFQKFVDSLLDLLLPSSEIIDYYGASEILFLGPDEGTADYMNWASNHARVRGAPFWKAFTTGARDCRACARVCRVAICLDTRDRQASRRRAAAYRTTRTA